MQTVLALDVHNDLKCRKKVIKLVSSVAGIDSIALDAKEKKLTLIGNMDIIQVVSKLRKVYQVQVITIGPANEPSKEKEKEKEKEKGKPNLKPESEVVTPIVYHHYVPCCLYYPRFYYDYYY